MTGNVSEALTAIDRERSYLVAERDAFATFTDEVQTLSMPPQKRVHVAVSGSMSASSTTNQLQNVRDQYRNTVMDVPKYEVNFGQSLRENMSAELGDEVAEAVLDGHQFNRTLQRVLVQQARAAAQRREEMIETFDRERSSITGAREALREVTDGIDEVTAPTLLEEPLSELVDHDRALRRERRRCENLLERRQREIHRLNSRFPRAGLFAVHTWLYHDMDVTFPVLSDSLEMVATIDECRRTILRTVADLP
ncbi:hypothetical protein OB905_00500 [Halobacteria archaeon AArc-dxtr1]|nr:hypothetical protein [Halobacteria archaeon AArc-dxtr1]